MDIITNENNQANQPNVISEIMTMHELDHHISKLDAVSTILFFDIDNTLLRTTMDIGSVEWIKWQEKMIHANDTNHPHCIADDFEDLYQKYQHWLTRTDCDTELLENSTVDFINKYISVGYKIVLVTARNRDTCNTTLGQLARYFDTSKFYSNELSIETVKNIYRSGVYFATGMNKGSCMKFLLHLYKLTFNYEPQNIIFVDDSMDECRRVAAEFSTSHINAKIFCYRHCAKFQQIFDQINKDELHRKWIDYYHN